LSFLLLSQGVDVARHYFTNPKYTYKFLGFCLLSLIGYQTESNAKVGDITEDMMQEMVSATPKFASGILAKTPCAKEIKSYRYKNEKGLVIEIVLKNLCCTKFKTSQITKALIDDIKSKSTWSGLTHWLQRGFFYYYIYKDQSGKTISEFRLDREAFIGKQFSRLIETEEPSGSIRIALQNSTLSFSPNGLEIFKEWAPGLPFTQKYGKWLFPQERYIFRKDSYSVALSVIALNKSASEIEQLNTINDGDFELQQRPISSVIKLDKIERLHVKTINLFTPVYHLIETIDNKKQLTYAYSSLIGNHLALYFVLTGPDHPDTETKVVNILDSMKFELIAEPDLQPRI
jgi:hypothetical protein